MDQQSNGTHDRRELSKLLNYRFTLGSVCPLAFLVIFHRCIFATAARLLLLLACWKQHIASVITGAVITRWLGSRGWLTPVLVIFRLNNRKQAFRAHRSAGPPHAPSSVVLPCGDSLFCRFCLSFSASVEPAQAQG